MQKLPVGLMALFAQDTQQEQIPKSCPSPLEPAQVGGVNLEDLPQVLSIEIDDLFPAASVSLVYDLGSQPMQSQLHKILDCRDFPVGNQIWGHFQLILYSLVERGKLAILPWRSLQFPLRFPQ